MKEIEAIVREELASPDMGPYGADSKAVVRNALDRAEDELRELAKALEAYAQRNNRGSYENSASSIFDNIMHAIEGVLHKYTRDVYNDEDGQDQYTRSKFHGE